MCEEHYLHKYSSYEDFSKAIDKYIIFYNTNRLQEKLNGLSPKFHRNNTVYSFVIS